MTLGRIISLRRRERITITTGDSGATCAGSGDRLPTVSISLVYGRVVSAGDVADPSNARLWACLIGEGLVGVATNGSIVEETAAGSPSKINVTARGNAINLRLAFSVDRSIRTALAMTGGANDFLQLGGTYRVEGRAGNRAIDFTARGAAETFRPH